MKLEIQKYLATHSPAELEAEFNIGCKRHPEFPSLAMFKYSQTAAPMSERIVRECRGIILNEADGWSVVSRPYDKFFNLGEGHASPIDWPSAHVYEKLDGSLMTLYHHAGRWHVASSGMPDAGGPLGTAAGTFAQCFWRVWNALGYALPRDTSLTYMFEMMTPHNRVVVPHNDERIVLHGARGTRDGCELTPMAAAVEGWSVVKRLPLTSAAECLSTAEVLEPLQNEGYVVCDKYFNRVKIKSPKYVALAHAKEGFNERAIIELVRTNEGSEFLTYFPELRPDYDRVKSSYLMTLDTIREAYDGIKSIPDQKSFAAEALKHPFSAVLFSIRAGKAASAEDFLKTATIFAAERILGKQ